MTGRAMLGVLILAIGLGALVSKRAAATEVLGTIEHQDRKRTFRIHLPKGHRKGVRSPLVLALHGGGGTAAGFDRMTRGQFSKEADARGWIVVFPQGVAKGWNDGRPLRSWRDRRRRGVDDVAFLRALIEHVDETYGVDRTRVYATGMSNGGFMSYRLGLELSDVVAAVAPVTATLPRVHAGKRPTHPVGLLVVNGTKDPLVPYDGGSVRVLGQDRGAILSTDETVKRWVVFNGAKPTPTVEQLPDRDPKDGTRTTYSLWPAGEAGAEVALLRVENGGHTWPGGKPYLPQALIGRTARDFEAAPRIFDFFARHRRVPIRPLLGIYGGMPTALMTKVGSLAASGVTAVWIGERGITAERIRRLREEGVAVYAEFNTLHRADYLKEHPDAAPVGPDGTRAAAPHGWQGICPTHAGYRAWRMKAFRQLITTFAVDGVWLDYHHAHASWERADPVLPDTCFCPRCLAAFSKDRDIELKGASVAETSKRILAEHREAWVEWRCGVFTDWVREFDAIRREGRRKITLGSFHCPWTDEERDRALRNKLAIDLRAQSRYLDVLSPMPYHARFGHADDPAWISRQTRWLAGHLGLKGAWGERPRIWPIVQLSDWGEKVPAAQVPTVLEHGLRSPSRGVIVFAWGGIKDDPAKLDALRAFFRGR